MRITDIGHAERVFEGLFETYRAHVDRTKSLGTIEGEGNSATTGTGGDVNAAPGGLRGPVNRRCEATDTVATHLSNGTVGVKERHRKRTVIKRG